MGCGGARGTVFRSRLGLDRNTTLAQSGLTFEDRQRGSYLINPLSPANVLNGRHSASNCSPTALNDSPWSRVDDMMAQLELR